jgi:hypothetical protein
MERLTRRCCRCGLCGAIALAAFVTIATGCGQAQGTRVTLGDALDVTVTSYDGEDGRTLYSVVARHGLPEASPDEGSLPAVPALLRARACRARETHLALAFRGHRPTGIRLHGTRASCDV